jgi:uncharacterized radical SAM protein YgiQ
MEDLYQLRGESFFPGYPPSVSYKIRPDRTTVVFSQRLREAYRGVPVIIGGIEASLRLFAHYDFQQDALRRSILLDSRADLLVTGPGEKQLTGVAELLNRGAQIEEINLAGTAKVSRTKEYYQRAVELPSYEEIKALPFKLVEAHMLLEKALHNCQGVIQRHGDRLIAAEAPEHYSQEDLDRIYGLPYKRTHNFKDSFSPALRMNLFSVTSHRGCAGGCSFCSLNLKEGRRVISRSHDSILREIKGFAAHPAWKGYVSDIGGPSAEMYGSSCAGKTCLRSSCLLPSRCRGFEWGRPYLQLLRDCRMLPGVKKIFVGSGLRYDLLLRYPDLLEEIMLHHCGKFIRIAPEHTEENVLCLMGKPSFKSLEDFVSLFNYIKKGLKRDVQLCPYLIVGHPGETARDVPAMKEKLSSLGLGTTDVQIFTPTPGTLSTAMYWAGYDPSGNAIPVEKNLKTLTMRRTYVSSSNFYRNKAAT